MSLRNIVDGIRQSFTIFSLHASSADVFFREWVFCADSVLYLFHSVVCSGIDLTLSNDNDMVQQTICNTFLLNSIDDFF